MDPSDRPGVLSRDQWTLIGVAGAVGVMLVIRRDEWLPKLRSWLLDHHILVDSGIVAIPALGALDGPRILAVVSVVVALGILGRIIRRAFAPTASN